MKAVVIKIAEIYVPAERRKEYDPSRLEQDCEDILAEDEQRPIQVRQGDGRYVLIKGVHRLEARKALGEDRIQAYIVSARQH